jgi:hypothetical protein
MNFANNDKGVRTATAIQNGDKSIVYETWPKMRFVGVIEYIDSSGSGDDLAKGLQAAVRQNVQHGTRWKSERNIRSASFRVTCWKKFPKPSSINSPMRLNETAWAGFARHRFAPRPFRVQENSWNVRQKERT